MNRTAIDWTDYSWNPIKGICPVGCWYCYARKIYKRFGLRAGIRLSQREVFCDMPHLPKKKIFVCSTIELFHPHIMPGWRDTIFSRIVQNQQHTFIILTKMPERIDRPMPDNVWLGVSVSGIDGDWKRVDELMNHKATIRFVSLEPFLGLISYPLPKIDWLICGRLTGHGKKYNPKKANIAALVEDCRAANIPLFMKNNLAGTWGKPLIQEYPLT